MGFVPPEDVKLTDGPLIDIDESHFNSLLTYFSDLPSCLTFSLIGLLIVIVAVFVAIVN